MRIASWNVVLLEVSDEPFIYKAYNIFWKRKIRPVLPLLMRNELSRYTVSHCPLVCSVLGMETPNGGRSSLRFDPKISTGRAESVWKDTNADDPLPFLRFFHVPSTETSTTPKGPNLTSMKKQTPCIVKALLHTVGSQEFQASLKCHVCRFDSHMGRILRQKLTFHMMMVGELKQGKWMD